MCILLNVKKHEKTFALNVDIFKECHLLRNSLHFKEESVTFSSLTVD